MRSQLASAAKSPEEAFRRMKNKSFVVETKFDGMQQHGIFQILSDPDEPLRHECDQDRSPRLAHFMHITCTSAFYIRSVAMK